MKLLKGLFAASIIGAAVGIYAQTPNKPADKSQAMQNAASAIPEKMPAVREITLVNIEYQGSKIWLPSPIIVKKGERVKLTLINNTPSGEHGFAIDEFGIKEIVGKEKKVVEFTADKPGLFRTYCQMHAAHITGELLILE